ncbi:MAG: isoleucine--tRNA ligase, partial [Alphaproteobacteria bacterium]|nr:isoleucine--tRNA ligase [Alphaproteobacteria bacterium]
DILKRIGRWADYENDYRTMDQTYMESVMWVIKELDKKGLLYKSYKTMAYSWGAETPSANYEIEYEERTDKAVTVLFPLKEEDNTSLVLWTTTPWTLPSNMLVAVGKDISYCLVEEDGQKYILAEGLVGKYFKEPTILRTMKGSELVGKEYTPPYPYFEDLRSQGAFKIQSAAFVTTEDGTGLVHIAPFGIDDYDLLVAHQIPIVCPVDARANFVDLVSDFKGLNVFEANEPIIQDLKKRDLLVKQETIVHNYPYCWRTKKPLIYKPIDSWFVSVQKIKDRMIELNKDINWIPDHIKTGRFGKWLENAKDWSITRTRFWGTPMPVWESDNPNFPRTDIFGSLAELEKATGQKIEDLHKPDIDKIVYPNPDDPSGQTMMRRTPEVMDCWFDAGSMPYGSVHHPFSGKSKEDILPADFIIEGQDQTRGWFYGLHVLSTALFDQPAYKTCTVNGMVVGEDKKKLSKSLKNYPDPMELFEDLGADSFRWYALNSAMFKAENLTIDSKGKLVEKEMRSAIIPFWNAYHFFTLYANADGITAKESWDSEHTLDQYILAKLSETISAVTACMDAYAFDKATAELSKFLEVLNNWYIRRSRSRFWGTGVSKESEQAAFDTLYTVLVSVSKLMAPVVPMLAEYIYQNLTGEESVHLADWDKPVEMARPRRELVGLMDVVRAICSTGKSVREDHQLRNRLPLTSGTIALAPYDLNTRHLREIDKPEFKQIIEDELNVKKVEITEKLEKFADKIPYLFTPIIGKRRGTALKEIISALKRKEYKHIDGKLNLGNCELLPDEWEMRLAVKEDLTGKALSDNTAVVILDTKITDDLYAEGLARDFVRLIQDERKRLDFHVSDRIKIVYQSEDEKVLAALKKFEAYIKDQVLADDMTIGTADQDGLLDGRSVKFTVQQ